MEPVRLEELEDEATYIKRNMQALDELRAQHRKQVMALLSVPGAPIKRIIALLEKTEKGSDE